MAEDLLTMPKVGTAESEFGVKRCYSDSTSLFNYTRKNDGVERRDWPDGPPTDVEVCESPPMSPVSITSSVTVDYETPLTSPCRSSLKSPPSKHHIAGSIAAGQLDGEDDASVTAIAPASDTGPEEEGHAPPSTTSLKRPGLSRFPSELLQHCERNATPRQLRLMNGGNQAADRFIPNRAGTPTKESLLLARQRPKHKPPFSSPSTADPFGPVAARSLRMMEQYATMRFPPTPTRSVGIPSRVQDAATPTRRAVSAGSIWTVGGTLVTEGVASVTNGRGGRVTSGTNAAHYSADFLRKHSPSEDELMHSIRLAAAMDINPESRMIVHTSPSPAASSPRGGDGGEIGSGKRVWKDGSWQQEAALTRTLNQNCSVYSC
jgi:hypothetical protein